MLKRILSLVGSGLLLASGASAQVFTLDADTVSERTTGTEVVPDILTIDLHTYIRNVSNEEVTYKWQYLHESSSYPQGWSIQGVCDNVECRTPGGAWLNGEVQNPFPIEPMTSNAKGLLEARISAPIGSPDGVGVFKVKVWTLDNGDETTVTQTDSVTYIVEKGPTGVQALLVSDKRVGMFPNPTAGHLSVYADRSLNVTKGFVTNILGRKEMDFALEAGQEVNTINTASLVAGIYFVHLVDANGNVIATRKVTRK